MLIIQQNCGKGYECIVFALKARLDLNTGIVYIYRPFFGNQSISHFGYNLYWPLKTDNRKDMQVLTAVKNDILHKVIIDN